MKHTKHSVSRQTARVQPNHPPSPNRWRFLRRGPTPRSGARSIFGLLLCVLVSFSAVQPAAALSHARTANAAPNAAPALTLLERLRATNVGGEITTDTTWTPAGNPYIVSTAINVISGVVLTVQPGVVVQFEASTLMTIKGKLIANGTATQPITFTGTSTQPGWWYGLTFSGAASAPVTGSSLNYVTVQYGGKGGYGNIDLYYASVDIAHSTIAHSGTDGVHGNAAGVANIADSALINNTGNAAYFVDGSVNPQLSNLTVTGNGTNAIAFGSGTLTGAHVWRSLGVPFIRSTTTLDTNGTLTVEPGVTVQFVESAQLLLKGRLTAVGTSAQPITFTGTTAQPGWWYGLSFNGTPSVPLLGSVLDYATVHYGGKGGYGNVDLYFATVDVLHSTIANSGTDGVHGNAGGVANISDTALVNNTRYPINFADGSINPQLVNLTVTGNGINAVAFASGALTASRTLNALSVPYEFGSLTVPGNMTLNVQPGVVVRFVDGAQLLVNGQLNAIGTPAQPITFTAVSGTPGAWYGIATSGSSQYAAATHLEYVTVEYGGRGGYANLDVFRGQLFASHSTIRNSGTDGVRVSADSNVSIESSHILGNAVYGVHNTSSSGVDLVMAANNWWGSAAGPKTDNTCNPAGTGDRVSTGVAYAPVLTNATQNTAVVLPSETRILTMTPNRWFAPADNLSRVILTLVLRDGNGNPIPGRKILLKSSIGSVQAGGITDARGQTLAILTSAQVGDADLRAFLDTTGCETARIATAKISFTAPAAADDYLPEEQAPYLNEGIKINPEPIIRGVPTRLSALMTNPNDFPIVVDAVFGFAQSGIGLAFADAGTVTGQVIPAKSSAVVETVWTPVVDGHYCVRFTYTARQASTQGNKPEAVGAVLAGGSSGRNLNIYPGPMGSPNEKDSLNKADNAFKAVSKIPGGPPGPSGTIVKGMIGSWWGWVKDTASQIAKNLGSDPPRQDYTQIATPKVITQPLNVPNGLVSPARTAAINEVTAAFLDMNAKGEAATITLDRYGGAGAAKNLAWASVQAASLIYYKQLYGQALITASLKLDALRQVAASEGVTTVPVTEAEVRAYQERLRTSGFTADEISNARLAGLTDAQIEANKQDILAADPAKAAVDVIIYLRDLANEFRALGQVLTSPPNFGGGISIGGGLRNGLLAQPAQGIQATAAVTPSHLVRVFNNVSTVIIANPTAQTSQIDLQVRRVDVPSDWLASVSPVSVTLAPGAQTGVTVTVVPGTSAVQGSVARVAVEGYLNGALLDNGGVVIDTLVPGYVFFDGKLRAFLPMVVR